MGYALLCVITQHIVVIPYRRFGMTYRSHLQWSRIFIFWIIVLEVGPINCPETLTGICHYTLCNIPTERMSQNTIWSVRFSKSVKTYLVQNLFRKYLYSLQEIGVNLQVFPLWIYLKNDMRGKTIKRLCDCKII